jgi:hypothetical protein
LIWAAADGHAQRRHARRVRSARGVGQYQQAGDQISDFCRHPTPEWTGISMILVIIVWYYYYYYYFNDY